MTEQIKTIQDEIWDALQKVARPAEFAVEAAREAEQERVAREAERIGVPLDDYKRWCAGGRLPHVRKAVLKNSR